MTDRELLELARAVYDTDFSEAAEKRLLRFAGLIEAKARTDEREACATICDHRKIVTPEWQMDQHYNQACSHCAQAIRLRGRV